MLPGCSETTTLCPSVEQHPVPVHLTGDIQVVHEALDVERKVRGIRTHQLLELLTFLIQSQQGSGVLFYIQFVFCPKFFGEVIYQSLIKIPTTYKRVKGSGQDLAEVKEQDQELLDEVCSVSFTQCSKTCHHCLLHSFRWHLATRDRPTKAFSQQVTDKKSLQTRKQTLFSLTSHPTGFIELQNILSWKGRTRITESNSEVNGPYRD